MWSLGVILYELCTLQKPYQANNVDELKAKVLNEKPLTPPPNTVTKDMWEIISKLLRKNPKSRFSINEVLEQVVIKQKSKIFKITLPSLKVSSTIKPQSSQQSTRAHYMTACKMLSDRATKDNQNKYTSKIPTLSS